MAGLARAPGPDAICRHDGPHPTATRATPRMTRGRAALAGVVGLLAVLLVAVWFGPGWLDWNRYRGSIAALLSDGLGRPVLIGGAITLRLLPQPTLTAAGLSVDDVGDGGVLRADAAELRVALGPLLAGHVVARELVLQGADLTLPWPPGPGTLAQRPPAWLSGLQARMEGSAIRVGGIAMTGISARVETDAETGTLTAAGVGRVDRDGASQGWRFSVRLARPGRDGSAPIEASIDGQDRLRDTGLAFSGQVAGDGALAGRVNGRGPNLSLLLPAPALAWRADGRLSASGGLVVADELAMELDGAPARGAVSVRIGNASHGEGPRLDMAIAAGRLDLDAWAPVLTRPPVLGLPTGIDLSADSATLAGGILRQLRGAFDLDTDGVTIRDLSARLPGDARLSVNGRMGRGGAFDGTTQLTAPDLATTLRWVGRMMPAGVGVPDLPGGVLQTAALGGALHIGTDAVSLTQLRGSLDSAGVTGTATWRPGPRPTLAVAFDFDRLTLDPWLLMPPPLPLGQDLDVQISAATALWRGTPVMGFVADARWTAERLTLRRLEGTIAGLRAQASGTALGGGAEPVHLQDGRVELATDDVAASKPVLLDLASAYGISIPPGLLTGPLSATLQASGPPRALHAKLNVTVGDLGIEAQPVFDPAGGWAGPVTLHHPGARRLFRMIGLDADWLGEGSASVVAQGVSWRRADAGPQTTIDSAEIVAGALRGRGSLGWDGAALTGQVAFDTLPVPEAAALDGWPVRRLQGWGGNLTVTAGAILLDQAVVLRDAGAGLSLRDGVLTVQNGTAQWRGAAATLAGTVDASSTPARLAGRAEVSGLRIEPGDAPITVTAGTLAGSLQAEATGQSVPSLLATLSGQGQAMVQDGVVRGFGLAALTDGLALPDPEAARGAVRDALLSGATPFDTLMLGVALRGGLGTLDGSLSVPAGTARLTGTIDVPAGLLDARIAVQPASAVPLSVDLRLLGPVGAPRRSPDLTGLSRWLAERP